LRQCTHRVRAMTLHKAPRSIAIRPILERIQGKGPYPSPARCSGRNSFLAGINRPRRCVDRMASGVGFGFMSNAPMRWRWTIEREGQNPQTNKKTKTPIFAGPVRWFVCFRQKPCRFGFADPIVMGDCATKAMIGALATGPIPAFAKKARRAVRRPRGRAARHNTISESEVPSDLEASILIWTLADIKAVAAGQRDQSSPPGARGREIPTGWIATATGRQNHRPQEFRQKGGRRSLMPLGGTEKAYKGALPGARSEVACAGWLTG